MLNINYLYVVLCPKLDMEGRGTMGHTCSYFMDHNQGMAWIMVPLCYRCISGLNLKCFTVILHAVLSIFFILSGFCRDDSKEEICGPAPVVMIRRRAQFWNSCRKLSNSAGPESFQQNLILLTNNTSIM